jgi:hypothetical protein
MARSDDLSLVNEHASEGAGVNGHGPKKLGPIDETIEAMLFFDLP